MTRKEAEELVKGLTEEQKVKLFQMLSFLQRSPEPAEPVQEKD